MWRKTYVCQFYLVSFALKVISKFSCGNIGKLSRIADAVTAASFTTLHPRKNPQAPFLVLGGFADFMVPSVYANGHGAITGLANLVPVGSVIFPHLFILVDSESLAFDCPLVQTRRII